MSGDAEAQGASQDDAKFQDDDKPQDARSQDAGSLGDPESEDILRAREFLANTRTALDYIVSNGEIWFPQSFSDPEFLELTRTAWGEVRPNLTDISEREWTTEEIDGLRREGLLGSQLHFKLAIFNRYYGTFSRQTAMFSRLPSWGWVTDAFWKPVYRVCRKLLKIINAILDSFKEVFPVLGAVKEVKDSVENVLEGHDLIEELDRP